MIGLEHALALSSCLFLIGLLGLLLRRNLLVVFMSIELILNAANLAFISFSRDQGHLEGQLTAFFVIAVAAAEAAVGLAITIAIFRNKATVQMDQLSVLKS